MKFPVAIGKCEKGQIIALRRNGDDDLIIKIEGSQQEHSLFQFLNMYNGEIEWDDRVMQELGLA